MRTISLFSGCGGLDIGASKAGAKIVLANDIMQNACETLRNNSPNTNIIEGNISEITSFPDADLVIGGYPCQSFSMGGNRKPGNDSRTLLYKEFARCLDIVEPKYFLAENVDGLRSLQKGKFLKEQVDTFTNAGRNGYRITTHRIDVKEYGVPQTRRRMLLVGVRKDLNKVFVFPEPTHGKATKKNPNLKPFTSHGEAIKDLPLWPEGEFYERPHDPEGHWAWYYMSRNRKKPWDGPAFTVVANWRHITLHPAGPVMKLTWSNLEDGWKQRWDFSDDYEHLENEPTRQTLETPRRLSWRECAKIQTFPDGFEPVGSVQEKFTQIGNAFPPLAAEIIFSSLISGKGLVTYQEPVEIDI